MPSILLAPVHCKLLKTWTKLASDSLQHSLTGSTAETTLATVAVPAAAMGPNGILRITHLWSYTNSANQKTVRLYFGSVLFTQIGHTTTATAQYMAIIRNRNAQNSQVAPGINSSGIGSATNAIVTATIDTSAAQNIEIKGQLANGSETMALESYLIELLYGA